MQGKVLEKEKNKKTLTFVIVGQLVQKRFFGHFARGVVQRVGHLCNMLVVVETVLVVLVLITHKSNTYKKKSENNKHCSCIQLPK